MIISGGGQQGSQPLDWSLSAPQLLASEIKQTFLSPQFASLLAFEQ